MEDYAWVPAGLNPKQVSQQPEEKTTFRISKLWIFLLSLDGSLRVCDSLYQND